MDHGPFHRTVLKMAQKEGLQAALRTAYCKALFGLRHNLSWPRTTHIFEREWDLLIVLDACRDDLLREVAPNYTFLPAEIDTVWSGASQSIEWIQNQFSDVYRDEMAQTAYVTGNPFSSEYLRDTDFALLDEVWQYAWDDEIGGIPARPLTDRTIMVGRERSPERVIVHYMQPHLPSLPEPLGSEMSLDLWGKKRNSIWEDLEAGRLDPAAVWRSYRANLKYVLDDVEILLSNFDASRAIITADHGNAFGECGLYGHPRHYPASVLRRVPWVITEANDGGEHSPDIERKQNVPPNETVNRRLRDLGYR